MKIKRVCHHVLRDYRGRVGSDATELGAGLEENRFHDLRLVGRELAYVAETDVPDRSGYLWECALEV